MITIIEWAIFLGMFWYFAQKGLKVFEYYLKKRAEAQSDDELFRYMLDRHWEPWAKSKNIFKVRYTKSRK